MNPSDPKFVEVEEGEQPGTTPPGAAEYHDPRIERLAVWAKGKKRTEFERTELYGIYLAALENGGRTGNPHIDGASDQGVRKRTRNALRAAWVKQKRLEERQAQARAQSLRHATAPVDIDLLPKKGQSKGKVKFRLRQEAASAPNL